MRTVRTSLILLLAALLAVACDWKPKPHEGPHEQVLIYYGMGYNNLSANLRQNLIDLQKDALPGLHNDVAIVAFIHNVAVSGNFSVPNAPVLIRIYRALDGKPVMDTLRRYDDMAVSASPASVRRVLNDIREAFPAKHYGMILSSHGTGWVPGGYVGNADIQPLSAERRSGPPQIYGPEGVWPETKTIGAQYSSASQFDSFSTYWLEVPEFAAAVPFHLDYLIIDTCLSGAVEVAWDLREVCDHLIVSPTEILSTGMGYSHLSTDMFASREPDFASYCRKYYEHYNAQYGSRRSGTIALVETAQLPALAEAFAAVLDEHRDALNYYRLSNTVQRYFYGSSSLRYFYDLRDLAAALGASPDELARLDAALAAAVPVHYETDSFFDLPLERCCGLSTYIPDPTRPQLNACYKNLGWNQVVGLIQ